MSRLSPIAALMLLACTSPRTEVILLMDTDLDVPSEVDTFVTVVTAPDGRQRSVRSSLAGGDAPLPRTTGVTHSGGRLGPFRVEATARIGDTIVLTRRANFSFVPDETRVLQLFFLRSCLGTVCSGEETCGASGCQSADVMRSEMPRYDGTLVGLGPDGGRDGGSPRDAGPDVDGGGGVDAGRDGGGGVDAGRDGGGGVDAGDCPAICSGGCADGECLIVDPTTDIRCPSGRPCHIRCVAEGACSERLHCPEDGSACVVACIGNNSCARGTDCEGASTCDVTCTGEDSCRGSNNCKDATACAFTCEGPNSCSGRTQCKSSRDCTAVCSGENSCAGAISCDVGSRCTIRCPAPGSCSSGTVCDEACACTVECMGRTTCGPGSTCPSGCNDRRGCTAVGSCDTC